MPFSAKPRPWCQRCAAVTSKRLPSGHVENENENENEDEDEDEDERPPQVTRWDGGGSSSSYDVLGRVKGQTRCRLLRMPRPLTQPPCAAEGVKSRRQGVGGADDFHSSLQEAHVRTERFEALDLSYRLIETLAPIASKIGRHDTDLAKQLRRAASSNALNLAEGSGRTANDRRRHFRIAAGSCKESQAALRVAEAWGYVNTTEFHSTYELFERLHSMLWRLTR